MFREANCPSPPCSFPRQADDHDGHKNERVDGACGEVFNHCMAPVTVGFQGPCRTCVAIQKDLQPPVSVP